MPTTVEALVVIVSVEVEDGEVVVSCKLLGIRDATGRSVMVALLTLAVRPIVICEKPRSFRVMVEVDVVPR